MLRKFILICIGGIFGVNTAQAQIDINKFVDIYGVNTAKATIIKSALQEDLQQLLNCIQPLANQGSTCPRQKPLADTIRSKLKKLDDFSYIALSPIIYPDNHNIYLTIDLVEVKDQHRLKYFKPTPNKALTTATVKALIDHWNTYEETGLKLLLSKGTIQNSISYPYSHCLYGFEEIELKPYESIFNQEIPKYKNQLVKILKQDKNPMHRKAAAYLLGHFLNKEELINTLLPSITDPNPSVRNAVMRVIAIYLQKYTPQHFDLKIILTALDFPAITDRNKALLILDVLSNHPKYAKLFAHETCPYLLAALKTNQPNIHLPAYHILKNISGKNFAENDYKNWENWFNSKIRKPFPLAS